MSLGSDFAAGASVGQGIQQRILAKKMQELETQRYGEKKAYIAGRDKIEDDRYAADKTYRSGRDSTGDSQWERSFGQQKTNAEQEHALRRETALQRGREFALGMISDDMKQVVGMRRSHLENQRLATEIERMKSGGSNPMANGYEETTTMDVDGNPTRIRRPLGSAAPVPSPAVHTSPEVKPFQDDIAAQQALIAEHLRQKALGDNRTGFLNYQSRDSAIAEARSKQAALQTALAQLTAQPGAQPAAPTTSVAPAAPMAPGAAPASPQDVQALQWAKANPNDPRAAAIVQRLAPR